MSTTQVVVIGAGPGGYAAAFYAADLGMQVALVDPEANPGGVCLYRGCIPSKALLHVAASSTRRSTPPPGASRSARRKSTSARSAAFKEQGRLAADGRRRAGRAVARRSTTSRGPRRFAIRESLEITAGRQAATETLTFEHAVIATGSRPATVPGLSIDSPRVMDSTGALDLPDVPKSLLVVGGGYIGLELGTVYAALGIEGHRRRDDRRPAARRRSRSGQRPRQARRRDVRSGAARNQGRRHEGSEGRRSPSRSRASCRRATAKEQTFDRVLVSIGRKPNSAVPGLDKTRREGRPARVHRSGRSAPHRRADDLRDRRRRRRADARAQGVARGARRDRFDRTARKSRSSRWRFPPSSSPTPSWRGAG